MTELQVRDAAPVFAALGDPTRLDLVRRLAAGGPGSITHLSANASVSRQAISKHLHLLASAGLVRCTRRGRERIWDLEPGRVAAANAYLERISQQWDAALDRLKHYVEE